jgi:hypothetical protein
MAFFASIIHNRQAQPPQAKRRLALGCFCLGLGILVASGCDSGSNNVPSSATQEQLYQVQKAQQNAASEEMSRQQAK